MNNYFHVQNNKIQNDKAVKFKIEFCSLRVRCWEKFPGKLSIAFGGEKKQSSKLSETRNKSNQKWEE
jgi:hypothetical protein